MDRNEICCPYCGCALQVPEGAESAVCANCARTVDLSAVLAAEGAAAPEDPEALLAPGLFTERLNMKKFNKTGYPVQYENYRALFRPALDAFARNAAGGGEAAAEEFAALLFRKFRGAMESAGKKADPFDFRFTIALLAVPSILSLGTPAADRAADLLLQKWNAGSPKKPIGKATYEQIQNGFRKKLCYITTAVCRSLGAGDDCVELNEFRAFRDGWLSHAPDGPEKIAEYYAFAPMIVRAIDASGGADGEYRRIWREHLAPCLREMRTGREADCARDYEAMVRTLERKWLA